MFVVSLSGSLFKKFFVPVLSVGVIALLCAFSMTSRNDFLKKDASVIVNGNNASSVELKDFISSYGWVVKSEPDDDVYENYNSIQLAQGFDLSSMKGQRVKRWTYTITNYPGYETEDCIKINILVYNGCVIGGDVCSIKLDGFMHGFEKE